MHYFTYGLGGFLIFAELCLFIVWAVFMLMTTLNNVAVYEQFMFDSVFHFAGIVILYYIMFHKYAKGKSFSFAPVLALTVVTFITIRNFIQTWNIVPRTIGPNNDMLYWQFLAAITTSCLILSCIEWLWAFGFFFMTSKFVFRIGGLMECLRQLVVMSDVTEKHWSGKRHGKKQTMDYEMMESKSNVEPTTYGLKAKPTYY
jgi:hypothetical protein